MSENLIWLLYKFVKAYMAFNMYKSQLTQDNINTSEDEFLQAWKRRAGGGE